MRTGREVMRQARRSGRRPLILATLLTCGHQIAEATVPVMIGVVVDRAVLPQDSSALVLWLAVLAGVFLVLTTCFRFGIRQSQGALLLAQRDLASRMAGRILDPVGGAGAGQLPGALVSTSTSDVVRVAEVMFLIPWATAAAAAVVYVAVVLVTVSPTLGAIVLVVVPLLLYGVHRLGKPIEKRSEAQQERAAAASGIAADLVAGIRVLKGIGAERNAVGRYVDRSRESLEATLRVTRAEAAFGGTVSLGSGLVLAVVALVAGRFAAQGEISVGGLITAVGVAQFLIGPLSVLGETSGQFAGARASAKRVADVLSSPPAVTPGTGTPAGGRGEVVLRGVTSGPVEKLDLRFAPGELTGVVAEVPYAAALVRLLARETEAEHGTIELDGVPLASLDLRRSREVLRVSAHDAALFSGSLAGNVAAGGPAHAAATTAAQVDQIVSDAVEGGDLEVGERGRALSGGQRQRVALARALAGEVPVLVLHDPTTAIDAVTEARIAAGLREVRAGRTTVLITTSPALLAECDRVVVLADGAEPAEGDHASLLAVDSYRSAVLA